MNPLHFLKGKQMLVLTLPPPFCCLFQSAGPSATLLCLPVLGPGHGQSFWRRFSTVAITPSCRRLVVWREPAGVVFTSYTPNSLVLLAVALSEPLSDQETLHQQSPVGHGSFLLFLEERSTNNTSCFLIKTLMKKQNKFIFLKNHLFKHVFTFIPGSCSGQS